MQAAPSSRGLATHEYRVGEAQAYPLSYECAHFHEVGIECIDCIEFWHVLAGCLDGLLAEVTSQGHGGLEKLVLVHVVHVVHVVVREEKPPEALGKRQKRHRHGIRSR